jgi:WD40 repeat protein
MPARAHINLCQGLTRVANEHLKLDAMLRRLKRNLMAPISLIGAACLIGNNANNGRAEVANVPTRYAIGRYAGVGAPASYRVWCVQFSPDGSSLASGNSDGLVRLWSLKTKKIERTFGSGHGWIQSVGFSANGSFIVGGGFKNSVGIWDTSTGRLERMLPGDDAGVNTLAIAPDGRTLAVGGYRQVALWDLKNGLLVRKVHAQGDQVAALAFSPDGKLLATGGSDEDYSANLWDVGTGRRLGSLSGLERDRAGVWSIAWSPDGTSLATAGSRVRIWDSRTYRLRRTLGQPSGTIWAVAYSPDGSLLASAGEDGVIRLWDSKAATLSHEIKGDGKPVRSLAFAAHGGILAGGSARLREGHIEEGRVGVWDPQTGVLLMALPPEQTGRSAFPGFRL